MSWQERLQQKLTIVTGDGKVYTPKWMFSEYSREFNNTVMEFPMLPGSLVQKLETKGRILPLDLVFDGADHLEQIQAFDQSSLDKRPWQIDHPRYGKILAQPLTISYTNEDLNTSMVQINCMETIQVMDVLKVTIAPVEKITADADLAKDSEIAAVTSDIPAVKVADKRSLLKDTMNQYKTTAGKIKAAADVSKYLNGYNKYIALLNSGTSSTVQIARALHDFSTMPYAFLDTVENRLNMLKLQYRIIRNNIGNLFTRTSKRLYESQSSFLLMGMAQSVVNNVGDSFRLVSGVLPVMRELKSIYDDWIISLDAISSPNGGQVDGYLPGADTIRNVSNLFSYTISALMEIALNSKQERSIRLTEDSNPVLLAKKYYGLDRADENLVFFIESNRIGISEMLELKKDRLIKYYV
ncbi:MAG: hypothetical protein BGO31_00170 [Bacteroidetes bacterium 43-16]|uniref:hypothetical protein n=1 Tax=uncultured Dysgonomonas sp. TaxID=206096 RepID=UPI0009271DB0|nr:hypothetical protein [uncultured Dysgonomonas sp.]OJV51654.1 MAG: hypothetical protein BGO31_00170 [Bacteroidetes bacterium 43-16]